MAHVLMTHVLMTHVLMTHVLMTMTFTTTIIHLCSLTFFQNRTKSDKFGHFPLVPLPVSVLPRPDVRLQTKK